MGVKVGREDVKNGRIEPSEKSSNKRPSSYRYPAHQEASGVCAAPEGLFHPFRGFPGRFKVRAYEMSVCG